MTKNYRLCLVLSILLFSVQINAGSSTNEQERFVSYLEPEKIGERLIYDWTGGHWQYQSMSGSYRFVITAAPENGANRLYLQWWRTLKGDERELSYSLSLRELNQAPTFKFFEVNCLNAACDAINIKTTHIFEDYEQDVHIDLVALGKYKVSW